MVLQLKWKVSVLGKYSIVFHSDWINLSMKIIKILQEKSPTVGITLLAVEMSLKSV